MKKLLSIVAILILIVIAVITFIGYKLIYTASAYYTGDANRSEKIVAGLREGRSILRTQLESQTGIFSDIGYKIYDIANTQTQHLIANLEKTGYIVDIQTKDMIVSYNIEVPAFMVTKLQQTTPGVGVSNLEMTTTDTAEMLAGIIAMTSGDRQQQEKAGLFNIEKITNSGDVVIAYTKALGVDATGVALEMFADMTHTIEQAIKSGSIVNIEKITYTMAYIEDITTKTGGIELTIDPIEWFDGTGANEAFAKYDPTGCSTSISGTNNTICTPPNGYFIYNADTGTFLTLEQKNGTLELIDITDPNGETYAGDRNEFSKEFASKYTNIPFHIYYNTNKEIIQATEQYIP